MLLSFLLFAVSEERIYPEAELNGEILRLDIHGGSKTNMGDFPSMALMIYDSDQVVFKRRRSKGICGGTILSDEWILTAAHCCTDFNPEEISFLVGTIYDPGCIKNSMCNNTYNLERRIEKYPGTIVRVEKLIIHPYYLNSTMNANYTAPADFCLAKVEKMNSNDRILNDKFIKPIQIATEELKQKQYCYVVGWGVVDNESGHTSAVAKKAVMRVLGDHHCQYYLTRLNGKYFNQHLQFCAIANERDTCSGDSGGPVICLENDNLSLFGTISFGSQECDKLGEASFFGRISGVHKWINNTIVGHGGSLHSECSCAHSITVSGRRCQKWNAKYPHQPHPRFLANLASLDNNLCANPDNDSRGNWCFTMDPNKRFDYCPKSCACR